MYVTFFSAKFENFQFKNKNSLYFFVTFCLPEEYRLYSLHGFHVDFNTNLFLISHSKPHLPLEWPISLIIHVSRPTHSTTHHGKFHSENKLFQKNESLMPKRDIINYTVFHLMVALVFQTCHDLD